MRTLVVDDQSSCRTLLQKLLSRMGHRVDCAENGRDAVLLYVHAAEQGQPYHFVCMDNEMPVMNGSLAVEMIRAWEQDHYKTARRSMICFVTGDVVCHCKYRETCGGDCLTRFFSKPLDVKRFVELAHAVADSCNQCSCNEPERMDHACSDRQ